MALDVRGEYLRARDMLVAVRGLPETKALALRLYDGLSDEGSFGALVQATREAEGLLEQKAFDERLHPRDWRGRWVSKHGGHRSSVMGMTHGWAGAPLYDWMPGEDGRGLIAPDGRVLIWRTPSGVRDSPFATHAGVLQANPELAGTSLDATFVVEPDGSVFFFSDDPRIKKWVLGSDPALHEARKAKARAAYREELHPRGTHGRWVSKHGAHRSSVMGLRHFVAGGGTAPLVDWMPGIDGRGLVAPDGRVLIWSTPDVNRIITHGHVTAVNLDLIGTPPEHMFIVDPDGAVHFYTDDPRVREKVLRSDPALYAATNRGR